MADEPPSGEQKQRDEATIMVPSRVQNPEESKEPQLPPGPNPELQDDKKAAAMVCVSFVDAPTMYYAHHQPSRRLLRPCAAQSAEDRELNDRLNLAVERLEDIEPELVRAALELLRKELRESTSSMTSVPKPLKFLGPKFAAIKKVYNAMAHLENKCKRTGAVATSRGHATALTCIWGWLFCCSLCSTVGGHSVLSSDDGWQGAQRELKI